MWLAVGQRSCHAPCTWYYNSCYWISFVPGLHQASKHLHSSQLTWQLPWCSKFVNRRFVGLLDLNLYLCLWWLFALHLQAVMDRHKIQVFSSFPEIRLDMDEIPVVWCGVDGACLKGIGLGVDGEKWFGVVVELPIDKEVCQCTCKFWIWGNGTIITVLGPICSTCCS